MVARSVAWPTPVNASEPCSDPFTPAKWKGEARMVSRKRAAATIGPIVYEDDGPTPTLNMSKTERNMGQPLGFEKKAPDTPSVRAARRAAGRGSTARGIAYPAGNSAH